MGEARAGGKFQKPRALKMEVSTDEIQKMQEGYEVRIARQGEAIGRLTRLLDERTADVKDHMDRANGWAAEVQDGIAPALTSWAKDAARFTEELTTDDLDELLRLIPPDWDLYNEDDTPRTILAAYIRHCTEDAEHCRAKQRMLVDNYQVPMDDLARVLGADGMPYIAKGLTIAQAAVHVINDLRRDLLNAQRDARANAGVANSALAAIHVGDISDVNPPDMGGPPASPSFVAPVVLEPTAQVPPPIEVSADGTREVLSWTGAEELMRRDEQRPGNGF